MFHISRDALPKKVQYLGRAVVAMNAGSPQFHHLLSEAFVGSEVEFVLAVIAGVLFCLFASLQAVGPNYAVRWQMFDNEVIAYFVELVVIVPALKCRGQTFSQFQVKYLETQPQRSEKI